ncbi:polyglutamine-binding protein 1-like [Ornithodoros turicata]|uniref:Polyglutamine-binding protein 1 n=1 Tax=Ornithodoros turicata TaxID=34597 RepID=A0A2R5LJ02_9ACAR
MPIPAALLARLKKRGIVKSDVSEPEQPEEEVIAEDYDDKPQENSGQNRSGPCPGCPNKWNIYHECTAYCYDTWKQGKVQESPNTKRKRLKMLVKYPLPDNWAEIYDPGTGRHYYWKHGSDDVSWLPPLHPRSKVSAPADKLRELIKDTDDGIDMDSGSDDDMDADEAEVHTSSERSRSDSHYRQSYRGREDNYRARETGRRVSKKNDLDPMDPSSYSDVPRGTWSTGLEKSNEAKTGADTTASGPLYQMRPYPSPGAVLRMNAQQKPSKKKDDSDSD